MSDLQYRLYELLLMKTLDGNSSFSPQYCQSPQRMLVDYHWIPSLFPIGDTTVHISSFHCYHGLKHINSVINKTGSCPCYFFITYSSLTFLFTKDIPNNDC